MICMICELRDAETGGLLLMYRAKLWEQLFCCYLIYSLAVGPP